MNRQQQLQELYIDWNELEAYRDLQKEPFCFHGEWVYDDWVYDDSQTSEDVYWKMEQWDIDNCIDILENDYYSDVFKKRKKKFKNKHNYYQNKLYDKQKLQKLKNTTCWVAWEKNKYSDDKPHYLGRSWFATNTKRFYKKYSNKQVRKNWELNNKGNDYRRVFDLWNEIW